MLKREEPEIKQVEKPSNDTSIDTNKSIGFKNLKKIKLLNLRPDAINETLLRCIKRFYLKKFKASNKTIVRRRYKHSKTSYILRALKIF